MGILGIMRGGNVGGADLKETMIREQAREIEGLKKKVERLERRNVDGEVGVAGRYAYLLKMFAIAVDRLGGSLEVSRVEFEGEEYTVRQTQKKDPGAEGITFSVTREEVRK